ncbi:MAG: YggS family pyridoxal phosphate-dependent enzyme [Planctomycetota bacterium]|nr:YggS family pyridoxal phosphate-dependent enzyme [Planctomycetota bacterium]
MEISRERLLANLRDVQDRIAAAAARSGRPATAVRLVAVTKTVSPATIRLLVEAGQRDLGENRPQQLRDRAATLGGPSTGSGQGLDVAWHMIGHLQRNKVKYVVPMAAMIHSVDSLALAEEIGKRAQAAAARAVFLLEVNVSGEASKGGASPAEAPALASAAAALAGVDLAGLMTMAPIAEDPKTVRPVFAALRELRDRINREAPLPQPLIELSMGMTQDYEVAIEEGATIVRVGTALFR